MYRAIKAKIHKESKNGTYFLVLAPQESLTDEVQRFAVSGIISGELRLDDGRVITSEQRKKIFATIGDICDWNGDLPEYLKEHMKFRYIAETGEDYFSLSNCSISTARHFINFLIDFALEWGVPLGETLIDRTDDVSAAIYASLKHKRCVICGRDGEIHHVDAIGMGNNRNVVDDNSLRKICLCRIHHAEAHTKGMSDFEALYHVYGIIFKD